MGYELEFTDIEIDQIGSDPFLIATALEDPQNLCWLLRKYPDPLRVG